MIDTRRRGVELPKAELAGTGPQRANQAGANPDTATVTPDRSKEVVASKAGDASE
jgi:hypothetical protein